MNKLQPRIHENGMDYVLVGDYYVPDLTRRMSRIWAVCSMVAVVLPALICPNLTRGMSRTC